MTNIAAVDLNLMTAFEAVMIERHVTRAAQRIGLAQPSMSNALARLRVLFDDPLFVRSGAGMRATEKAVAIAPLIDAALTALRSVVNEGGMFDPARTTLTFRLATTDYGELLVVPRLLDRLRTQAPGARLLSLPYDRPALEQQLERGQIDAGLSVIGPMSARIMTERQFDERFVCIARADHPRLSPASDGEATGRFDLETFVQLDHALVSRGGPPSGAVDRALAELGKRRNVVATVANFTALMVLVAQSDMVAAVGERIAMQMSRLLGLAIIRLPLPVDGFRMTLAWHDTTEADAGQRWFRDQLRAVCAELRGEQAIDRVR